MSERYQLEEPGISESPINFFEKSIEQIITLQNALLSNIQKTIQPIIARERAKINEVQEGSLEQKSADRAVWPELRFGPCWMRGPLKSVKSTICEG